ncbi:hypothetical protein Aperf_G00000102897 [Anoplocephala perfoliata]
MAEDLANIIVPVARITGGEERPTGKRRADQLHEDGNDSTYPTYPQPPVLKPQASLTLPNVLNHIPLQLPRDRSNSVDTHVYQTIYTQGGESSSRGISSSSSSSPMHFMMHPSTPPHSLMKTHPHGVSTSSNSILLGILVNNNRGLSRDNQKCLMSNKSETKKYKSDDSIDRRIMPPPSINSRRYSFGGEASRSHARRRMEIAIQNGAERALTLPTSSKLSDSPILYSLINSLSTNSSPDSQKPDSASDFPLDLTPSSRHVEYVHLANKVAQTVQAKVTTYLRWSADYVFTYKIPSMNWYFVFKSVWHRLLIVCMAEHGLDIVYVVSKQVPETLSTGEAVLPWIDIAKDPRDIIPTRAFAEKVIECIEYLRKLRMSPEDYRELRNIIRFTSNHRSNLTEQAVKVLHNRWKTTKPNYGSDSKELLSLTNAIQRLEELKAAPLAGLLCSHLRGEASKDLILSQKMRNSIKDIDGSILGSLICDTPDPDLVMRLTS